MCNLYTVRKSVDEVARHFGVTPPTLPNAPAEAYPGSPGLVIREQDGQRVLQSMTCGFPLRLSTMKPDSKPKAVNNIADSNPPLYVGVSSSGYAYLSSMGSQTPLGRYYYFQVSKKF